MNSLLDWVTLIGGVAGLIVLGTGAVLFIKGSYNKARIEALRADIADYKQREDSHDRDMADCKNEVEILRTRNEHLHDEVELLREMVTQRADVEAVMKALDTHHVQTIKALGAIKDAIVEGGESS